MQVTTIVGFPAGTGTTGAGPGTNEPSDTPTTTGRQNIKQKNALVIIVFIEWN